MRSIDRRVVGSTPIGTLGVIFSPSTPMSFTEQYLLSIIIIVVDEAVFDEMAFCELVSITTESAEAFRVGNIIRQLFSLSFEQFRHNLPPKQHKMFSNDKTSINYEIKSNKIWLLRDNVRK